MKIKIDINKSIQSALEHCQSGNFKQAETICKKILQVQPNNVNILNLLGVIYQKLENCVLAEKYIKKAIEQNPTNSNLHYNLGNVYKDKYQLDEAVTYYQKALQLNPGFFEAYHNLGTVLQDKGQLDDAMANYQKALQLNPNLVDGYFSMGTVLQDKGQLDDAKACYRKAIQLNPNDMSLYFDISHVSQLEGQRFAPKKSTLCDQWTPGTYIFQVDNEKRLLYLEIPKVGSTTIKRELIWKPIFGNFTPSIINFHMHLIIGYKFTKTLAPYKDYFKFTVVRDPYTRFMSAYFFGVHKKYRKKYDLHKTLGIEDWPDEILNDPNKFIHHVDKEMLNRDGHTALQTKFLPKDLDELDYIGQLENMEEVGSKLSQVTNVEIKFDVLHLKGPITDYHSFEIDADRFNKIFMEDYETLNKFYKPLNSL